MTVWVLYIPWLSVHDTICKPGRYAGTLKEWENEEKCMRLQVLEEYLLHRQNSLDPMEYYMGSDSKTRQSLQTMGMMEQGLVKRHALTNG
jgi:hypothetical protein